MDIASPWEEIPAENRSQPRVRNTDEIAFDDGFRRGSELADDGEPLGPRPEGVSDAYWSGMKAGYAGDRHPALARRKNKEMYVAQRKTAARPIYEIASEIKRTWRNVNYAAQPYLDAMMYLNTIDDRFYADSADSVIAYFLSNAQSFRGEDAKRLKQELKDIMQRKASKVATRKTAEMYGLWDGKGSKDDVDFVYSSESEAARAGIEDGESGLKVLMRWSSGEIEELGDPEDLADEMGLDRDATRKTAAADGETSHCRICGIEMEAQDYAWYALTSSSPQRSVPEHFHIPARVSDWPGEYNARGELSPGTPGGGGGQYDAPAGTIYDAGGNAIPVTSSRRRSEGARKTAGYMIPVYDLYNEVVFSINAQGDSYLEAEAAVEELIEDNEQWVLHPDVDVSQFKDHTRKSQGRKTSSKKRAVSKSKQEQVLEALKAQYADILGQGLFPDPTLMDYEGRPMIIWEEGPFEWAYLFPHGGIEEEFGFTIPSVADKMPDGVYVEPYYSFSISIFDDPQVSYRSAARKTSGVSLTNIKVVDRAQGIFSGKDSSGAEVKFQVSQADADDLMTVLTGDLAVNFSGVEVDESEIIS